MVVVAPAGEGIARCEAAGAESEVMTDLVGPVTAGEKLLVHAGVALATRRLLLADEVHVADLVADRLDREVVDSEGGLGFALYSVRARPFLGVRDETRPLGPLSGVVGRE